MKNFVNTYHNFLNESKELTYSMVKSRLDFWEVEGYKILDNLEVYVDGVLTIDATKGDLSELGIQFSEVYGNFYINEISIDSLKGCPRHVTKMTYIVDLPNLKTLKGCPQKVGAIFIYDCPNLKSLEFLPKEISGRFECNNNGLLSLVFAIKEPHDYDKNPCTHIYQKLGFTTEAHVESLITLDEDLHGTMEKLKVQFPERYEELIQDKRLRIELGMESEELKQAYDVSKNVEGDFY